MKHNLLKSVIISVILLMGVSNAWAWNYPVGSVVYFEKPNNWSNAQFMIGHDSYSAAYNMTVITNTKLYRYQHTGTNWNGYGAWAVVDAKDWPAENNKIANRVGSVNNYIWYNEIQKYTLVQSDYAVSNNTSSFTSLLNKTQTITIQNYNTSNKKFEASNNTAGSVTAKYYAFSSSATSVGNQVSTSITNSSSISAAYTSTVTLTASAKSGYQFVGWYDGTTLLSNNTTYSHIVPNSEKTIYARFIKTDAINTPVYLKTGDWKNDNARFAVYAFENTSGFKMWIDMSELDCSGTREYFTCKVPSNTIVILCRLNPDGSDSSNGGNNWTNKWGQTKDLTVGENNYWKFTGWDSNSDGNDEGTWTAYTAPTYTVTLVADSHGTYNVKSGNTTMTSKLSGNVTMNVALNSKITITTNTPEPGYDQSQGAAITIGKNDKQKATLGAEYTICGPTTIAGNFVSTEEQVVYLQPTGHWNGDNAQYKAFVFHDTGSKWMTSLMNNVTCETDDQACYTCTLPAGYNSVIFCRVKDNTVNSFSSGNLWNQTNDLAIPVKSENNCYKITAIGSHGEKSSGNWKTFTTPTYDVTIKPTIHCTYSVVCNGRAYPVTYKKDVVIPDVPMGTVLTIQDVKPNKEAEYTDDIIYKESANAEYQKLVGNQITVCGNTTIDENFVTENPHVVYLRIPNGLAWGTDEHQYLYAYDKLEDETVPLTAEPTPNNYEPGYTYYTCTIPTGTHTIRFEYNNQYQTHDFPHVMPLGSLNCYTIQSKEGETSIFNGYWSELLSIGDYRLLYVEQVVEKDKNNKTVITRKKAHPSNIIKQRTETGTDIVSLHVYNQNRYNATYKWEEETPLTYETSSNSAVILQQYDGSKWVDIQHHMVFGPLEAHVYTAMLPGRRNATAEDEPLVAQLKADYGIKAIINDTDEDKGNGVWNFPIQQTVDDDKTTVELMREDVRRYEGDYYIRTDVANGGWFNYNPTNHMTRSDEAKANSNFSHYYCKWVESNNNVNVKFTVANDYGYAISDTLEADRTDLWGEALAAGDKMVTDQKLPKNANIRFAWNEYSNFVHRAYIAGSAVVGERFLVLEGDANIFDANGNSLAAGVDNGTDPRYGLNANEEIFRDNSNWIYYADVQMKPMAPVKVTAKYNGKTQYFIGKQNETVTLLQGSGEEKYLIRMLYDFKTNQLISAYVPGASPDVHAISTNLMLIRQNNNEATQLIFNNETPSDMINIPTDRRAYGVIEFTKERLIDDTEINEYARSLYWISFPFNVDVSKAISFGEYGKHWIIQEYNGERRAKEGMWLDSETFWDYKWDQKITLDAGKGYVLALDVDQIASDNLFSLAGNRPIGIYFPSTEYISTAITEQTQVSTTVPAWECTINRNTPKGDRRIADSHWNVIGVPSYRNTTGTYQFADIKTKPEEVKYYYHWNGNFNDYIAMETKSPQDFQSTFAYMVQFTGQINWQNIFNVHGVPQGLAAKQSTDSEQEHRLRLELHQKDNKADHTFVRLQDEDGVTNRFDFNHDLCKVINAGANIYSIITAEESPVEVAANVMPIAETIIPVGVKITAAGEYTFTMPEGTDGIVVELIDYENNTRTNMLLDEYTVNLEKGTFDNRFALHVKPNKTTTSLEDVNTNTTGVKKYLIDGILYMQKDGVLYDAQGKLVR